MRITFYGATGTVTGSRFLVEHHGLRVLVDCGLYQGRKALRLRNWESFPVSPDTIDAVVLTHAHIDHSGMLPVLVRDGFTGSIFCTTGSATLLRILLPDAAHLQEEEARYRNKEGVTRHNPALPLYTAADSLAVLEHLDPQPMHVPIDLGKGLSATFQNAGHILGAATVRLEADGTSVLFSGDVGRKSDPVHKAPESAGNADVLVMEATYGDRAHGDEDPAEELLKVVLRTAERGGTLVIPAFAVGRTQLILHLLAGLKEQGRLPDIPVFLDSPMAIHTTDAFFEAPGTHRLRHDDVSRIRELVQFTPTPEESTLLTVRPGAKIVISASGMASGGRILHHLRRALPNRKNTVLLVGFQAAGTRGEALENGCPTVRIFGLDLRVECEVARITSLSAHADADELMEWLCETAEPRHTFLVHGRPSGLQAMADRLLDERGWQATIPEFGDSFVVS
jgi:metallo-beta-lactamase family protein